MSTPSNPSSIMIYKIVRDYENTGRTMHLIKELDCFSQKVIDFANTISDDNYWILQTSKTKEDLLKICDVSSSFCELNEQKYNNGGDQFAKIKIGQMPYSWLKGALTSLKECEEADKQKLANTPVSTDYNIDEAKNTNSVSEDKSSIVMEQDNLSK